MADAVNIRSEPVGSRRSTYAAIGDLIMPPARIA
jgi:hypothetical protein